MPSTEWSSPLSLERPRPGWRMDIYRIAKSITFICLLIFRSQQSTESSDEPKTEFMLRLLAAAGLANGHVLERLSVERECAGRRAGHRSLPLAGNKLASMWLQLVKTGRPNLLVENQIFTVLKHLSGVGTQMVLHSDRLCLTRRWRRAWREAADVRRPRQQRPAAAAGQPRRSSVRFSSRE